jgi:hypothetical protein
MVRRSQEVPHCLAMWRGCCRIRRSGIVSFFARESSFMATGKLTVLFQRSLDCNCRGNGHVCSPPQEGISLRCRRDWSQPYWFQHRSYANATSGPAADYSSTTAILRSSSASSKHRQCTSTSTILCSTPGPRATPILACR